MQRKITRLALAARCGSPDKPPMEFGPLAALSQSGLAKLAKAVAPKPSDVRLRNERRFISVTICCEESCMSVSGDGFAEVQQRLAKHSPRSGLRLGHAGGQFQHADGEQLVGCLCVGLVAFACFAEERPGHV